MLPKALGDWATKSLHRLSRACSPREYKPWIDAVFGEVGALNGGRHKLAWGVSVLRVLILGYFEAGTRLIWSHLLPAVALSLVLTVVAVVIAEVVYEGHPQIDDIFSVLFQVSGGVTILLFALQLVRLTPRAVTILRSMFRNSRRGSV